MSNPLTELIMADGSSVFVPFEAYEYEIFVPMDPNLGSVKFNQLVDCSTYKVSLELDVRKFRWIRGYNTPAGKVHVYKEVSDEVD